MLYLPRPWKLTRIFERRFVAWALFRDDVQQHRHVLRLQELEGLDQQVHIVAIDRAIVAHAELFKNHPRGRRGLLACGEHDALGALFNFASKMAHAFASDLLQERRRALMQGGVGRVGGDVGEVFRDGTDVLVDLPLVVVQHHNQLLRAATLFSASKVGPQVKAASPATQMTCSSVPFKSRAAAMPSAALSAVPA